MGLVNWVFSHHLRGIQLPQPDSKRIVIGLLQLLLPPPQGKGMEEEEEEEVGYPHDVWKWVD
jgi:hypothetical protein